MQNWYQQAPPDFRFAVKAPRAITHYKKFNNAADFISSFYDTINRGLQEKLGPVLFQAPPNFIYSEERLDRIIQSLSPSFKNVFEPRHISWWQDQVYQKLAEHGITFCGMSHPLLPDDIIQNTDVIYYRFHGVPDLYRSRYPMPFLERTVNAIKQNSSDKEAWCYFNNDYDATGVFNAKEMIALAGQS